MNNKKRMTKQEFLNEYSDEFNDYATEVVLNNSEDYFDGYTAWTYNDVAEAIEGNEEDLIDDFIEFHELNIAIIR